MIPGGSLTIVRGQICQHVPFRIYPVLAEKTVQRRRGIDPVRQILNRESFSRARLLVTGEELQSFLLRKSDSRSGIGPIESDLPLSPLREASTVSFPVSARSSVG